MYYGARQKSGERRHQITRGSLRFVGEGLQGYFAAVVARGRGAERLHAERPHACGDVWVYIGEDAMNLLLLPTIVVLRERDRARVRQVEGREHGRYVRVRQQRV